MKLLLADDHTLFRDALVLYIERAEPQASISLAKDFTEALEIMKKNPDQDLVLLDFRMPGMNGMEGFTKMRDDYPTVRVALMSGVAEPEDVKAAMSLGAVGYFPKTLSGKNLIKAIKSVLDGEIFLPRVEGQEAIMPSYYNDNPAMSSQMGGNSNAGPVLLFTAREKDVIKYLALGHSNKEMAAFLGIQVVTVKLHVRSVCQKLGARNRTQAALMVRDIV
jgi:two-component system nitrate/nitrite response regulator NarL